MTGLQSRPRHRTIPVRIRRLLRAIRSRLTRPSLSSEESRGSTLLMALLILAALAILATTAIVSSVADRRMSRYDKDSVQALAVAETGIAFAKRAVVEQTAPMQDYDSDGRPDFVLADSTSWGGTYRVVAEASDVLDEGVAAYFTNGFTLLSEGRYHGAIRRVKVEIAHDSFLKFARFISSQNLQFECGDVMAGEVYTGGNITLACGCPAGEEPRFLEEVYASGSVPQSGCGIFDQGFEEGVQDIDLMDSLDWDLIRDKARGLGTDTACDGGGVIGVYSNLPGVDPLGLGTQAGADQDVLVLSNFDFYNTTLAPPDTVIMYNGNPVMNALTGSPMRLCDFNGVVFFEGDAKVRGSLDGVSGYYVSVYATDHCLIENDVICGHTGFDPVTRLPNQSGSPVTAALVSENYVAMDVGSPRILQIDAAIFSRTDNWRALGGIAQHPPGGPGPLDLDLDGIYGETPHNNDPIPGEGWDELNITEFHWVLNLTGPLITYKQGDAYPWNAEPVLMNASGSTHRYNYDVEYMHFPPPCFPVPINLWLDVSWTEIHDSRAPLANYLPN